MATRRLLRRTVLALLALPTALPTALPAQDRDEPTPAPMLRLLTRDVALAQALALALGAEPHDFQLPQDAGHCLVVVRHDLTVEQTVAPAPMRPDTRMEVFLKPAVALAALQPRIQELRRTWDPRVDAVLQQFGYPSGFGRQLVGDALALLPMISGIYLREVGNLRAPEAAGAALHVDLVPEAGSPLHEYIKLLSPAPGAIHLPATATDGAAGTLLLSLNPENLPAIVAPWSLLGVAMGARGEAELSAARTDLARALAAWDGTLSAALRDGALTAFLGLRDPAAWSAWSTDPMRLARQQESYRRRRIDLEWQPDAMRHRDCAALRTTVESAAPGAGLPTAMASFTCVAGAHAVIVGGTAPVPAAVRAAIDLALDGGLPRRPAADAAMLVLDLDTARLLDMLSPGGGIRLGDDGPRRLRLVVHKIGITLKTRLELR